MSMNERGRGAHHGAAPHGVGAPQSALLRVEQITVATGDAVLLRNITLRLDAGEVLALLGANGAGKSTLIAAINGEIAVDSGEVTLDDTPIASLTLAQLAERRALTVTEAAGPFDLPVFEYVALGRPFEAARASAIDAALAACHAGPWRDRLFATLSTGEQLRVQLARSLYQLGEAERALWLLDEPCAHLDVAQQRFVLHLLQNIAKTRRWGIIFSTHNPAEALTIADQALLLRAGQCVCYGKTADTISEATLTACYGVAMKRADSFIAA